MSGEYGWQRFVDQVVAPGYRARALVRAGLQSAIFAADDEQGSPALIHTIRCGGEECEAYWRRFMEARFLEHPNLLGVREAGRAVSEGWEFAYAATEFSSEPLQAQDRVSPERMTAICRDLLGALEYLHSENLIYCALREETVWSAGNSWKLGDFHQLRLSGKAKTAETRALMGRMPEIPPEAFEGAVTPAWDVWSLGVTISKVLRHGSTDRRPTPLPEPFEEIVNRCLDSDPGSRITLAEIRYLLDSEAPAPVAMPMEERDAMAEAVGQRAAAPVMAPEPDSQPVYSVTGTRLRSRRMEKEPRRRRWVPFAIAGGLIGAVLTLFALRRDVPAEVSPKDPGPVASDSRPVESKPNPTVTPDAAQADRLKPGVAQTVQSLLEKWVDSTRAKDVGRQLECYAPTVDTYYGRHAVSARDLRGEKSRQFSAIGRVNKFSLSHVRIKPIGANVAVVDFRKEWDFSTFSGAEKGQFVVRQTNGAWRITSEREGTVFWTRRR